MLLCNYECLLNIYFALVREGSKRLKKCQKLKLLIPRLNNLYLVHAKERNTLNALTDVMYYGGIHIFGSAGMKCINPAQLKFYFGSIQLSRTSNIVVKFRSGPHMIKPLSWNIPASWSILVFRSEKGASENY